MLRINFQRLLQRVYNRIRASFDMHTEGFARRLPAKRLLTIAEFTFSFQGGTLKTKSVKLKLDETVYLLYNVE